MILVNNISVEYFEGITLSTLIDSAVLENHSLKKFKDSANIYIRNGNIVQREHLDKTLLKDGDMVKILPLISGG